MSQPAASPRRSVYGRNYSYFSHRIFVVYMPEEMHKYLDERLELVSATAGESTTESDRLDRQLVRWVLLQRSQLNALALNRLLESWRGADDLLAIPPGLRSDPQYLMDITLQVALELALASAQQSPMLHSRPRLLMALMDAAYFLSRQRLEVDRRPGSDTTAAIDLSSNGLDDFRRYLVQRMNLEEDRHETRTEQQPATMPTVPLSDEEVKWLLGIAAGVARTLTPACSKAEIERRWQRDVAPRWKKLGLADPDQALFDALLVGDKAPLREEELAMATTAATTDARSGPASAHRVGSLRFRWRESAFPRSAWHASLDMIVATSRPALRCIRAIEGTVRRAMSAAARPGSTTPAMPWRPLEDLADRYRLLPTTPSWSSVAQAIDNLQRAARGLGSLEEVYRDAQMVRSYADMICRAETAEVVHRALHLAAFLAGMRAGWDSVPPGPQPTPWPVPQAARLPSLADWEQALSVLSNGLRCNEVDLPELTHRLKALWGDLMDMPPPITSPSIGRSEPVVVRRPTLASWRQPRGRSLPEQTGLASGAGREAVTAIHVQQHAFGRLAWRSAVERAAAGTEPSTVAPAAGGAEVICELLGFGPALYLPLRPERATLRQWTRVAAHALRESPPSMQEAWDDELREQLLMRALERLGLRTLDPALQDDVVKKLRNVTIVLRGKDERLSPIVGMSNNWRLAIVVGPRHASITEGWPLPPREGLVLAVMDHELDLLDRLIDALKVGPLPVQPLLATEPLPKASVSRVEQWVNRRLVEPPQRLWLTRSSQTIDQHPQLVDPKSADELWDATTTSPPTAR
ncbi:hypothetical protein [Leptothrix discophora]|uniref:Uncharacterized protein n=1 Tax=Leptothrix discophora TaxID=89 RepID=A0ABT9FXS9_LEPDI|nr:hypothetical protein [Leptothrix discophora]MDP4299041.1 hypothetical protein [Leptothrix discophora]